MKAAGAISREELQPAAPRPAPAGHRGRARARHDGRARGRLALPAQHDAWSSTATPASSTRSRVAQRLRRRRRSSGRATKVGYTPTLVVGYGGLWGENYWYAEDERVGEPAAARVRAARSSSIARSRRRADGAGGRVQPLQHARRSRSSCSTAGVTRPARRARPARGPRGALGALDARPGRHDAARGAARAPRSTAPATSASTATSARSSRASSPTWSSSTATRSRTSASPRRSRCDDGQRPPLRRGDAERDGSRDASARSTGGSEAHPKGMTRGRGGVGGCHERRVDASELSGFSRRARARRRAFRPSIAASYPGPRGAHPARVPSPAPESPCR